MHIFWHNDGVSVRPDNAEEHDALVLLWSNAKLGWPDDLRSSHLKDVTHLVVTDQERMVVPSPSSA